MFEQYGVPAETWDGVGEMWFDSLEDWLNVSQTINGRAVIQGKSYFDLVYIEKPTLTRVSI